MRKAKQSKVERITEERDEARAEVSLARDMVASYQDERDRARLEEALARLSALPVFPDSVVATTTVPEEAPSEDAADEIERLTEERDEALAKVERLLAGARAVAEIIIGVEDSHSGYRSGDHDALLEWAKAVHPVCERYPRDQRAVKEPEEGEG
jgi:uncharacterized protein YhaN